ncbi:endonuclease VII domain-containing protein [Streptomyces noursei]|uniref:endonuclease VII domain-containing protein n=1 Tax=Streptomyces noursei TaxID=1971 RepID=UPI00167B57A5|nr:endonuclease VII domain-containing protein [Streptomyces noursei]MCZ1015593.1 endonuclease VII domain-containing protein [Streptomyces noursei]GGW89334.1 hypothetical protein GCM10010341_07650 [Streptomyces noursei]
MTGPRKGYRQCARCDKNRATRFFTPRGTVCETCRKATRRATARNNRLIATYSLTSEEYQQLFEHQGGRCAICQETRTKHLAVDHCHKTEAIRGLLCQRCNGHLLARGARDRPDVLRRAADYLEHYPAWESLGPRFTYDKDSQ